MSCCDTHGGTPQPHLLAMHSFSDALTNAHHYAPQPRSPLQPGRDWLYAHTHTHTHTYRKHTYIDTHIVFCFLYKQTHTENKIHKCSNRNKHTHRGTHTQARPPTHTHTHTHTQTETHTHTHTTTTTPTPTPTPTPTHTHAFTIYFCACCRWISFLFATWGDTFNGADWCDFLSSHFSHSILSRLGVRSSHLMKYHLPGGYPGSKPCFKWYVYIYI